MQTFNIEIKTSLGYGLWHCTSIYLTVSLSCDVVFLNQGNNFAVVYCSCFLWFSPPFDVAELASELALRM